MSSSNTPVIDPKQLLDMDKDDIEEVVSKLDAETKANIFSQSQATVAHAMDVVLVSSPGFRDRLKQGKVFVTPASEIDNDRLIQELGGQEIHDKLLIIARICTTE